MKPLLLAVFALAMTTGIVAQVSPAREQLANKQKLARIDSLVGVMEKKKRELGGLLDEFLNQSRQLEKVKDSSVKGVTIQQRLASAERNAQKRTASGKTTVSPQLIAVEKTVQRIKKINDELKAEKEKINKMKDSMSEMNEMDMLMLQQLMDKKNQLETMISNVMKAGYEGGQAAVQALKAS